MNQDGLLDWLVVVKIKSGYDGWTQLYALIQTKDGISPILLGATLDKIETLQTSCHQYFPKNGSVPVQIYRLGSKGIAFQIITLGDQSYPFIHFEEGDPEYETMKIRGVEQNDDIISLFLDNYQEQYQWNNTHQKFELINKTNEYHYIEERILTMKDYDTAISILVDRLSEPPPEPFEGDTYNGFLISTHFYLRNTPYETYLLGLAYELNGEKQNAAQTYFNLWQTFPESSFTIIARHKLEIVK